MHTLAIKEIKSQTPGIRFDFFIDGQPLSTMLGIDRLNLAYCRFGLDIFDIDAERFPNHPPRKMVVTDNVAVFLGQSPPINQFGTHRVVLYGCHCGSDYCGIISFTLDCSHGTIKWKNVGYEDDDGHEGLTEYHAPTVVNNIACLEFDRVAYTKLFDQFVMNYCQ